VRRRPGAYAAGRRAAMGSWSSRSPARSTQACSGERRTRVHGDCAGGLASALDVQCPPRVLISGRPPGKIVQPVTRCKLDRLRIVILTKSVKRNSHGCNPVKAPLPVVHYGLGPIGLEIARLVAQRPALRSAGAIDISPELAGRDLGELAGGL